LKTPPRGFTPTGDQLLRATELVDERYRALAARAGHGLFRATPDGRIVEINDTLATMLGFPDAGSLIGRRIDMDVYVNARDFEVMMALAGGEDFSRFIETRWKRCDGSPVTARVALRATWDLEGTPVVDGMVEDVTERLHYQEMMRRSERLASLGTTLAGVAHELNNPLAAITGFTQLMLRRTVSEEDRTALETINHEALRAANIVRDLLALARQREVERREALFVNDVLGYVARTRRYALESHGVLLALDLDPDTPLVLGDSMQVEQVILNLVSNAEQALRSRVESQASGSGGVGSRPEIILRSRAADATAVIEVDDNGPGIPEEMLPRIWDPFWTTKDEGEGTGLGLSVVHGIVSSHGGTIDATRSPTGGARFTIRLPSMRAVNAPVPDVDRNVRAARPLDILVTVANGDDLMFVVRFLTSRGHTVLSADDPERALRLAGALEFDAVICDADEYVDERAALARHGRRLLEVRRPFDVEEIRSAIED
jgi:PAS domain S-box-containing protein